MTLTSSVPVPRVSDYQRARAFRRDVLRFEIVEETDDPVTDPDGNIVCCEEDA